MRQGIEARQLGAREIRSVRGQELLREVQGAVHLIGECTMDVGHPAVVGDEIAETPNLRHLQHSATQASERARACDLDEEVVAQAAVYARPRR
ncbi:hypothetical protein FQZ97_1123020 [compost metagenome]